MRKTTKLLAVIAVALLIATASSSFLKDTIKYWSLCEAIQDAESVAEQGIFINGHRVVWTNEQTENYDKAVARKNAFIEKSDVAQFLSDCGNSVTGKIMRMVDILLLLAIFIFSLSLSFKCIRRLIKIWYNLLKKSARQIFKRAKV